MSDIKWGYSFSQWNAWSNTARMEEMERAFKVMSVCGCTGVELVAGSGRWEPLGRPELIDINFKSPDGLKCLLKECNLSDGVTGWFYDPGQMFAEENSFGRNPSDPAQHQAIADSVKFFAEYLSRLGGKYIAVRPMQSYWKEQPVTEAKINAAADCWNKVAKAISEYGIELYLHIDWLCAIHSIEDIGKLLAACDKSIGLAIDTAELTLAGMCPIEVYEKFADRVKLFHFKDVHYKDEYDEYKTPFAEDLLKSGGKRKIGRWFYEMGWEEGLVDFPALIKSIKKHGYKGWIILESNQSPNPSTSAMLNNWYIQNVLSKV